MDGIIPDHSYNIERLLDFSWETIFNQRGDIIINFLARLP